MRCSEPAGVKGIVCYATPTAEAFRAYSGFLRDVPNQFRFLNARMIRHNSANDSTFIGRLRGKRPDWTQKIGSFSGKTQKMGRILVRAQIAAMIEELRDCRSILEGLDSQFKEAAVTLALNKQLTLDQFHLLRAFGALTLSKNIEYEAYCRAVDDGSFAVDHQTQCELIYA